MCVDGSTLDGGTTEVEGCEDSLSDAVGSLCLEVLIYFIGQLLVLENQERKLDARDMYEVDCEVKAFLPTKADIPS